MARHHDDLLKEARQDLVRAETKLRIERNWRWPIRVGCVALGAVGLAAWQNDEVRSGVVAFVASFFTQIRTSGIETLVTLGVALAVMAGAFFLIRRLIRGPSPEQRARKLMDQFARTDGVAAYVFTGQENAEEEAAAIGSLLRPPTKRFRQRRLNHSNRPLASSIQRILNQRPDSPDGAVHLVPQPTTTQTGNA